MKIRDKIDEWHDQINVKKIGEFASDSEFININNSPDFFSSSSEDFEFDDSERDNQEKTLESQDPSQFITIKKNPRARHSFATQDISLSKPMKEQKITTIYKN